MIIEDFKKIIEGPESASGRSFSPGKAIRCGSSAERSNQAPSLPPPYLNQYVLYYSTYPIWLGGSSYMSRYAALFLNLTMA